VKTSREPRACVGERAVRRAPVWFIGEDQAERTNAPTLRAASVIRSTMGKVRTTVWRDPASKNRPPYAAPIRSKPPRISDLTKWLGAESNRRHANFQAAKSESIQTHSGSFRQSCQHLGHLTPLSSLIQNRQPPWSWGPIRARPIGRGSSAFRSRPETVCAPQGSAIPPISSSSWMVRVGVHVRPGELVIRGTTRNRTWLALSNGSQLATSRLCSRATHGLTGQLTSRIRPLGTGQRR
jgi:hypothetical protein